MTKKNHPDYDFSDLSRISVGPIEMLVTSRIKRHYTARPYEGFSADLFSHYAAGQERIIDVGAHYGYYSLLAARNSPGAEIHAFEPVSENCQILEKNAALNSSENLTIHNLAVSDKEEKALFNVAAASDSSGFYQHPLTKTIDSREVESVSLDHLFSSLPVGLVKVDTEGHELKVLRGMEKLIQDNDNIKLFVEFNPKCLRAAGADPDDLLQNLIDKGFDIYLIHDTARRLFRLTDNVDRWPKLMSANAYANLLCIKHQHSLFVSFVSHLAMKTGSEKSLIEVVDGLTRRGVLCDVLLPSDGPLRQELMTRPVSCHRASFSWWTLRRDEEPAAANARIVDSCINVTSALRKRNPHLVYTNPSVVNAGAVAAKILGRPHVWHVREYGEEDHRLSFALDFSRRLKFIENSSQHVIFNSQALRTHYGYNSSSRIASVVYNSVQMRESNSTPRSRHFSKRDALKLLILGAVHPGKGQLDAVLAVKKLLEKDLPVELLIVGLVSSSTYLEKVKDTVRRYGLSEHVKILGHTEGPAEVISEADILLVCSESEAFGRVAVEGMLLKKPVIAARSGGLMELVSDYQNGLLYEPHDITELAEKIAYLAGSPSRVDKLVSRAYPLAKAFTDEKRNSERILQILRRLKDGQANVATSASSLDDILASMVREISDTAARGGLPRDLPPAKTRALVSLWTDRNSFLNRTGWFSSYEKRIPVRSNGSALPWFTYGTIRFLNRRTSPGMAVFEYGCGYSTFWWARRAGSVVSCEHDKEWAEEIARRARDNVTIIYKELVYGGDYSKAILDLDSNFDIIVIDGRDRVNCAMNAVKRLKSNGVIIWDNTDRRRYQKGYLFLQEQGFNRLDFAGMGPVNTSGWMTSIFYRPDNCLAI